MIIITINNDNNNNNEKKMERLWIKLSMNGMQSDKPLCR